MVIYNCTVIKRGGRNILNKGYCMRRVLNYVFSLIFMIVSLGNNYWCTKDSAMDKDEDPKKMSQ